MTKRIFYYTLYSSGALRKGESAAGEEQRHCEDGFADEAMTLRMLGIASQSLAMTDSIILFKHRTAKRHLSEIILLKRS